MSILGLWQLDSLARWILLLANVLYVAGVQCPTFAVNVQLNNQLQAVDVAEADEATISQARQDFEARWNASNLVRTVISIFVTLLLLWGLRQY